MSDEATLVARCISLAARPTRRVRLENQDARWLGHDEEL